MNLTFTNCILTQNYCLMHSLYSNSPSVPKLPFISVLFFYHAIENSTFLTHIFFVSLHLEKWPQGVLFSWLSSFHGEFKCRMSLSFESLGYFFLFKFRLLCLGMDTIQVLYIASQCHTEPQTTTGYSITEDIVFDHLTSGLHQTSPLWRWHYIPVAVSNLWAG